ncbi:TetR/AcrR family transcriptional regulator [Deltaproteobacteria bacterium PRO3]|nr:TetR/AcrR family transcriptional regulator [Deltaproteobacteria bacterium PRO3]
MPLNAQKTGSEKYQKIIQAATKVFAQKGFYNSKVADVAKEAKVADGTIYLYFKNKDDLLISIFENSMDTFSGEMQKIVAGVSDPIEKLRRFIKLHLELVRENQDTAQVLQIELRQSSKFMKEYAATKFRDYLGHIALILEEGQAKGVFKKSVNPLIVKRAIFGAVDEMALDWVLMKKKKYTMEEVAEQLCSMFIEGLKA